ncbi:MAG: DMT family transporter [bacterium]|nr:DMT family transporter [bacterium]
MSATRPAKAWALLILLSLIWGSSFILIKKGLLNLSATEVGAIRIIAAALFLLPIAIKRMWGLGTRKITLLFIIGLVGSFVPAFLFAVAQTNLESSITGVINALTPLFVILMGFFFFSQKFTSRIIIGLVLGFIGTTVLIVSGKDLNIGAINGYALYVVLATMMYGVNLNVIKYYLKDIDSLSITSISLVMVMPLAFVLLFGFTEFTMKIQDSQNFGAIGYILILGVVGTAVALIIFNHLVKITDPVFTSSVTYIIPIVAIIWGLLDGEKLFLMHYIGIFMILLGVWHSNTKRKNRLATSQ